MMKHISLYLSFLCFLIFAGIVLAEDEFQKEGKKDNVIYKYKKDTTVEFSEVELEGAFQKPEGYYSLKAKKTKFETLISPKYDFMDELKNSVFSIDEE